MSTLKVKPNALVSESGNVKTLSGKVNSCTSSINNVQNFLSRHSEYAGLGNKLSVVRNNILEEAARMNSLADALNHIAEAYIEVSRKVGSCLPNECAKFWNNIKQAISDYKERVAERKRQERERERAREIEKKQDMYLQSEVFKLLDQKKYSKKTWQKASVEERKQILNDLMRDVNRIMGTNITKDIEFVNNATYRGAYSDGSRQVKINADKLSGKDSYVLMQTIIHEMRHAYQHEVVRHPENFNVSPETVSIWKANIADYKSSKEYGYEAYVTQPIEWDAKNFAKQFSDLKGQPEYSGSW